jgi:hypothetical protein
LVEINEVIGTALGTVDRVEAESRKRLKDAGAEGGIGAIVAAAFFRPPAPVPTEGGGRRKPGQQS